MPSQLTANPSARNARARIADLLTGSQERTATIKAAVSAQVAAFALTAFDPSTFGFLAVAAGDADCSITAGQAIVTSPNNPWSSLDVGDAFHMQGAGPAGGTLTTTILSYQGPGQVTLAANASTTVAASITSASGLAVWGIPTPNVIAGTLRDQQGRILSPGNLDLTNFPTATVAAAGASTARTLADHFSDRINVRNFGAAGNGVTDDRAAVVAAGVVAGATGEIVFTPGVYLINSNLTISSSVRFLPGSRISVPTGVTVTISKAVAAGVYQIFSLAGTGVVALNPNAVSIGFPEWWGATTGGADCLAAIGNCVAQCPVTVMQAGDYFLSAVLKINTPGRTIKGSTPFYNGVTGDSTRLIAPDGSATCVQIGPDAQPGSINLFLQGVTLRDVQLSRGAAPVILSNCVGLRVQYALYPMIINVKSVESMRGFEFIGAVGMHVDDCWAARSSAGTAGGTDYWWGFYINGNITIPASGGNASIYFNRPNATLSGGPSTNSAGIYVDNKWADTFLEFPEVNGCSTGISVQGNSSAVLGYGETDLHITRPVVDTYTFAGIHINNLSRYGSVSINGGFAAASTGSSPTASIYVQASLGSVSILNFQHIAGPAVTMTAALLCINSQNVSSKGCVYLECNSLAVALSTSHNCTIIDRALNNNNTLAAVAQLTSSNGNKLEMSCSGAASKVTLGYQLVAAANNRNELNCTGLDSGCISTGSGNKLTINGAQVTVTGLSGTNLVSGVMT